MASKPELDYGGYEMLRAYVQLSTCRAIGMSPGPVPMWAVWQWEDRNGIVDETLRRFVEDTIGLVDARVMKRLEAKSSAASSTSSVNKGERLHVSDRRRRKPGKSSNR